MCGIGVVQHRFGPTWLDQSRGRRQVGLSPAKGVGHERIAE
jgi:hypothetical protein